MEHINIKTEFGAKGDGQTDDSDSFIAAVKLAPIESVVYIPPGTYHLSKQINITRSDIILRGAGFDRTILYFNQSLSDMHGTQNMKVPSMWSFGPGVINVLGDPERNIDDMPGVMTNLYIADVVQPAVRGSRRVTVSSTDGFVPGHWITILQVRQYTYAAWTLLYVTACSNIQKYPCLLCLMSIVQGWLVQDAFLDFNECKMMTASDCSAKGASCWYAGPRFPCSRCHLRHLCSLCKALHTHVSALVRRMMINRVTCF